MRTIKFRGFDIGPEEKGWVYGYLTSGTKITQTGVEPRLMVAGYEVAEGSIGQFTGLCDKNGKEIYEGDIIRFCKGQKKDKSGHWVDDTEDRVVIWAHCGFSISDLSECEDSIEVIDNIYENPELLKQGQ